MEWNQLVQFQKVAQLEHMTKASEELYITQPSLTQSIHRLEKELGIALFDRRGRKIELNEYGKIFLSFVDIALNEYEYAQKRIAELKRKKNNTVTLCAPPMFMPPQLLEKLYELCPMLTLGSAFQGDINTQIKRLIDTTYDLFIFRGTVEHDDIEYVTIGEEPECVLVPYGHKLAGRESVDISELRDEKFATFSKEIISRSRMEDICSSAGFEPQIVYESDNSRELLLNVRMGHGITLSHEMMGKFYVMDGIQSIRLTGIDSRFLKLNLFWRKASENNKTILALQEAIVNFYESVKISELKL